MGTLNVANASPTSVAAPRMFSAMSVCMACLAMAGSGLFAFGSGLVPAGTKYASARVLSPLQQKFPYTRNVPPG